MNDDLQRMSEEVLVAYFKALSLYSPTGTKETH